MKKIFILAAVCLISCCDSESYNIEHTCLLGKITCVHNLYILKRGIRTYKADGGAYVIQNMKTSQIVEAASINYDLNKQYHPRFLKINVDESITLENLIKKYSFLVKNNPQLKPMLRENITQGVARNANIDGVNVYAVTTTTNRADSKVFTTFLGHFEIDGKQYAVAVTLDNPKALESTYGFRTTGWNATRMAKDILLGVISGTTE